MAKRNEHSLAEIKAMVLKATETIIIEEGFSALTIRKIAMEIGYTVGSIYMVFKSRAELILHVNALTLEDMVSNLQPVTETSDIDAWLAAYLTYTRANTNRWRMIFTPQPLEDNPLPDWYQEKLDAVFQQFFNYFTVGNAEQTQPAVRAVWQGIHGVILLSPDNEVDANAHLLLSTFLRGWHSRATQALSQ